MDSAHRRQGIAKRLCGMIWSASDDVVSGLVTSHPHAVRALEAATNARCDPSLTSHYAPSLIKESALPYVRDAPLVAGGTTIDSRFFVDHTQIDTLVEEEIARRAWALGRVGAGHEFFAFIFHQPMRRSP